MNNIFEINCYGGLYYLESGEVVFSVHQSIESAISAFRKLQKCYNYKIVLKEQGKRYF